MNTRKPSFVPSALAGGLLLGLFSGIPILNCLNCACCLAVIAGGVLSSYLYLRNYPGNLPPVNYGDGAILGVLTGLFGTVFWAFIHVFFLFIKHLVGFSMAGVQTLRRLISNPDIPPEVRQTLEEILEGYVSSDVMTPFYLILSVMIMAVISVIFASIGSILGVALFQNSQPGSPRQ